MSSVNTTFLCLFFISINWPSLFFIKKTQIISLILLSRFLVFIFGTLWVQWLSSFRWLCRRGYVFFFAVSWFFTRIQWFWLIYFGESQVFSWSQIRDLWVFIWLRWVIFRFSFFGRKVHHFQIWLMIFVFKGYWIIFWVFAVFSDTLRGQWQFSVWIWVFYFQVTWSTVPVLLRFVAVSNRRYWLLNCFVFWFMRRCFMTVWICFRTHVLAFWWLTITNGAWIRVFSDGGLWVGWVTVPAGSISMTRMTVSTNNFSTLLIPALTLCHPVPLMPMRSFSPTVQSVMITSTFYTQCRQWFCSSGFPTMRCSFYVSFHFTNPVFSTS